MNIKEFRQVQNDCTVTYLTTLALASRLRFLSAAHLLEIKNEVIGSVSALGIRSGINIRPLRRSYRTLAARYVDSFYSPQMKLFPLPGETQDEQWSRYWYHYLVPDLVENDDVVRDVLRALQVLPCKNIEAAVFEIEQYCTEFDMPEIKSYWTPTFFEFDIFKPKALKTEVVLEKIENENGMQRLTAYLRKDGTISIEGHDLGKEVEKAFGRYEYEWQWTIESKDVHLLKEALGGKEDILRVLEKEYSGLNSLKLQSFLENNKIPFDFWSRIGD